MKIALAIFSDFPGGDAPARRIHMIARGLVASGHQVRVIVPQRFRPGPLETRLDGFEIRWGAMTTPGSWHQPGARVAARRAAFRRVREAAVDGFDWLLVSNPGLDGLGFLLAARSGGTRVAAMYDDLRAKPSRFSLSRRLRYAWWILGDRLLPRFSDLNVAISRFLQARLARMAPHTPAVILPPLTDLRVFQPDAVAAAAFRRRWNLDDDPIIAYLGTYWSVDGVEVLLRAAARLAKDGERFRLVVAGAAHEGLDCDNVGELVQILGLQERVVETGWLPLAEVTAAMAAADILVVPKLDHVANRAGVPTKLAEYMAMGRAVVASRIGDIPAYLSDQHDAVLCGPGDLDGWTEALRCLLRDPARRSRLASAARETASRYFDCTAAVQAVATAMAAITGRRAEG